MSQTFPIWRIFKVRESGNAEFWISNLIVMASTIIGVYLAAQAGFTTALQFEVARSERDGYYLRRALLDEVQDNLGSVDDWSRSFEKALRNRISETYFLPSDTWVGYWSDKNGWSNAGIVPDELKMKTFVWETMKQQSITFQLPPELISAVRRYYDNMEGNMRDIRSRDWQAGHAAKAILEDTRRMREDVVPAFERDISELRASLQAKSVPIR
ncbi:MAG TPA: hypothetical protein VE986_00990 [Hyphomicrobiales bacterium]|nr:hypothetical protein [Hyphomicrobiales bacterium]